MTSISISILVMAYFLFFHRRREEAAIQKSIQEATKIAELEEEKNELELKERDRIANLRVCLIDLKCQEMVAFLYIVNELRIVL